MLNNRIYKQIQKLNKLTILYKNYKSKNKLQYIAAYIDNKGNINTDISQTKSNNLFISINEAQKLLKEFKYDCINKAQAYFQYKIINDIRLCRISFINNKNNNIVMEWQVGKIDDISYQNACKEFDNNLNNINIYQQDKLMKNFEDIYNENYYIGVLIIFKNNILIFKKHNFYSKQLSLNELKIEGQNLINSYYNQYLNC